MDSVEHYRKVIQDLLRRYAAFQPARGDVKI